MNETHPATNGRQGGARLGRGGLPHHPRAPRPGYPASSPPPAEHPTPRDPHHPRGEANGGRELPKGAGDRPSDLRHHPRGEGDDGRDAGDGSGGVSAGGSGGISGGVLETPGPGPKNLRHVAVRTPASGDPDSWREAKTASSLRRAGVAAVAVAIGSPVATAPSSHDQGHPDVPLFVRWRVRPVGGDAGRALAAGQGRALAALLATLGEVEVGQGEEVSP